MVFSFFYLSYYSLMANFKNIILDCDTGRDDALAIWLFHCFKMNIVSGAGVYRFCSLNVAARIWPQRVVYSIIQVRVPYKYINKNSCTKENLNILLM